MPYTGKVYAHVLLFKKQEEKKEGKKKEKIESRWEKKSRANKWVGRCAAAASEPRSREKTSDAGGGDAELGDDMFRQRFPAAPAACKAPIY